ncbi:MAG: acyl-CoA dehydrogenase family protein [Halioglobus sp.]
MNDDINTEASSLDDSAQSQRLLLESAHRLFGDHCDKALLDSAERGEFAAELASKLAEYGFHRLAERESGFALADVFALLKVAGYHALPVPLAEWMLANRWLDAEADDAVLTSMGQRRESAVVDVPWGQQAQACLAVTQDGVLFKTEAGTWTSSKNSAGEPYDALHDSELVAVGCSEQPYELLALSRCAMAVGAMQRLLEMVVEQVTMREQFGRPLARFQVIQHAVAGVAAEVAVAGKAHDGALAFLNTDRQRDEIAIAKARIGEATGIVTDTVHQLFGAMGFTHEHILHHYTRRLWVWREDFGNEQYWQQVLGSSLCARGADQVWPFLATVR